MTWDEHDTESLREVGRGNTHAARSAGLAGAGYVALEERAADEIERLRARVAELELEVSATMQASQRRDAERMELCGNMATMRRRIAALEAERAEVVRELRALKRLDELDTYCEGLVVRLERKDTDG